MKIKDLITQLNTFDPEMEILVTDTPLIGDGSMQGYARSVVKGYVALQYSKRYNLKYKEKIVLIRHRSSKELETFNKYET